jgi:hypothetical protein
MQELRDIAGQEDRRQLRTFGVTDLFNQVARIARAQVGDELITDQNTQPCTRSLFAFSFISSGFP